MRNDFQIVPAKAEHLKEIAELERNTFSLPWSEDSFRAELENEDSHFTAAVLDGTVAGFSILRSFFEEGELLNIAVCSSHRGKGIGNALLEDGLLYADSHGVDTVFLEVRPTNRSAIALYKKHVFEPNALRKNNYDEPK